MDEEILHLTEQDLVDIAGKEKVEEVKDDIGHYLKTDVASDEGKAVFQVLYDHILDKASKYDTENGDPLEFLGGIASLAFSVGYMFGSGKLEEIAKIFLVD
jgi:hypothetical protein